MHHGLSGGDSVLKQASALITPILFFAPMMHPWAVDSLVVILCSNKPVPWYTPISLFAHLICITEQ